MSETMRRTVEIAIAMMLAVVTASSGRSELPDLSGTWVMVQIYPEITTVPLAGEVSRTSTVAQFVEIRQDGGSLTMLDHYCFTAIDDGTALVRTEIPDAFMASLDPSPRVATVRETDDGIVFEQEEYVEVRGAILDRPGVDALPDDPQDPRVIDQDGDGHPGMTVRVTILGMVRGEIYVVQRVRYRLHGHVVNAERIEGRIAWDDEQSILAATHALLRVDAPASPDPEPTAHRFVMLRADPSWDCATLREHVASIVGES